MDTFAAASKGIDFKPLYNDTIYAVRVVFTTVNLATYQLSVGTLDPAGPITSITKSSPQVAIGAIRQVLQFNVTYQFVANEFNFFLLTRTDSTNTYALPININQPTHALYPISQSATIRLASNNPQLGNSVTGINAANASPFGFRINQ
jgi:hypothetical protein